MWRLVVCYRYLLLACLTLAGAIGVEYQLGRQPLSGFHSPSPALTPSPLQEKYLRIEEGMTVAQVREILGPPAEKEPVVSDCELWSWQDGRTSVWVIVCIAFKGGVIAKHFHEFQERSLPQ
jgi:hypothetical protein